MCTHNQCFESKIRKISKFVLGKFSIFASIKHLCILHWHVFVMIQIYLETVLITVCMVR